MKTMQATDAKNNFGKLIEDCMSENILVQKNGRDVAVVMSMAEYDLLRKASDATELVAQLHEDSIHEFHDVYQELAK